MAKVDSMTSQITEEVTVAGLLGRMRLQKHTASLISSSNNPVIKPNLKLIESSKTSKLDLGNYTTRSYKKNWMEIERSHLQAYEYLCHMSEAKQWIEVCIQADLGPLEDLGVALQNGVYLARLAKIFQPKIVKRIYTGEKLQFRHSDNINFFLEAIQASGLPKVIASLFGF